jgi:hypothetical protein
LSPSDHMDVAKRRQRAEVEQLAYDLKILRAERDMLLQEMERKDEQARFMALRLLLR